MRKGPAFTEIVRRFVLGGPGPLSETNFVNLETLPTDGELFTPAQLWSNALEVFGRDTLIDLLGEEVTDFSERTISNEKLLERARLVMLGTDNFKGFVPANDYVLGGIPLSFRISWSGGADRGSVALNSGLVSLAITHNAVHIPNEEFFHTTEIHTAVNGPWNPLLTEIVPDLGEGLFRDMRRDAGVDASVNPFVNYNGNYRLVGGEGDPTMTVAKSCVLKYSGKYGAHDVMREFNFETGEITTPVISNEEV